MFDGVKLEFEIKDFDSWKVKTGMGEKLTTGYNETNGLRKERTRGNKTTVLHIGQWEHYRIEIKEVHKENTTLYHLHINGSFHKNYFGGANFKVFTFADFLMEVNHLQNGLNLIPALTAIHNIEFGVNVETPFPPFEYLKNNLLLHRTKEFTKYNAGANNGKVLGYHCKRDQFDIKIYDKGLQHDLPCNLMRFELRITTMRWLKKSKTTLSDICQYTTAYNLIRPLLAAWDCLLWSDSTIDVKKLTAKERELYLWGCSAKHWQIFHNDNSRKTYCEKRAAFTKLITKHGANLPHQVRPKLIEVWESCFNKQGTHSPPAHVMDNIFLGTDSPPAQQQPVTPNGNTFTVKVKGECVPFNLGKVSKGSLPNNPNPIKRGCLTCGADITHQPPRSKYCSPKNVGEAAAHKCRNAASNPRNNHKKKIEKIKMNGLLFPLDTFMVQPPNLPFSNL